MSSKAQTVTDVLLYLDNHRFEAVEALFPSATDGYKREWLEREPVRFWSNLDLSNRNQVVKLAEKYYEGG